MEGIFLGGSILAAFLAGAVALFAPCCILVVFPAYLSAAVRNARWRLVPLTLVFAAGLAVVLVPVSLGFALLSRALLAFHSTVYVLGGVLLLTLAWVAYTGRTWSLPFLRGAPEIQRTDSAGVFALGVFSGAASSCCAPVLAGVLTLTAMSSSTLTGAGIALAYVFGMVFPLLVMTLVWDRTHLRDRMQSRVREVEVRLAGRTYHTTNLNVLMAGVFTLMGIVLVALGLSGETVAPSFQAGLAGRIEDALTPVMRVLEPVPTWLGALLLIGLGVGVAAWSARSRVSTLDTDSDQELQPPVTAAVGTGRSDQEGSDHGHHCH